MEDPRTKVPFIGTIDIVKVLSIVGSIFLVSIFVRLPRRAGNMLILITSALFLLFQDTLPTLSRHRHNGQFILGCMMPPAACDYC